MSAVLGAGFPLVAFLQLCRVYGQALAQIAEAEVRLFHLYVHEPLIREGVPGLQMAEEMGDLARDLLPLASPMMDYVHQRFLQHFVEQDVVGHMESELEDEDVDLGRVRVAIAFADLAGYTRFTEEEGEEEALSSVERFVEGVTNTLPEDARVVKTIGDEVMVVGQDIRALVDWAVGFTSLFDERPEPRIGVHWGTTLYRDGDYFGRDVNLTARVVARARGGEVLVTDSVVEAVSDSTHLSFEPIGQVKLKGFAEPRQLCRARAARGMSELPLEAARDSGLVRAGEPLLVMVSGGGDSVALLDIADRLGARVSALHVNYGLRDDASLDEALVQQLCDERDIPLTVEQVRLGTEGATSRSALATLATRSPRRSPRATTPPPTPPPTRRRPFSTAWPSRRDRGRCTGCRRGAAGWCARCSA